MSKNTVFQIRLSKERKEAYELAASKENMTLASWIKMSLDSAIDKPSPVQNVITSVSVERDVITNVITNEQNVITSPVIKTPNPYRNPNGHHITCKCEQCKPPRKG